METTDRLGNLLDKHPKCTLSNSAAVLLFAVKDRTNSPEDMLEYIKSKLKSVRPSHSPLNYISDYANNLAREPVAQYLPNPTVLGPIAA